MNEQSDEDERDGKVKAEVGGGRLVGLCCVTVSLFLFSVSQAKQCTIKRTVAAEGNRRHC